MIFPPTLDKSRITFVTSLFISKATIPAESPATRAALNRRWWDVFMQTNRLLVIAAIAMRNSASRIAKHTVDTSRQHGLPCEDRERLKLRAEIMYDITAMLDAAIATFSEK